MKTKVEHIKQSKACPGVDGVIIDRTSRFGNKYWKYLEPNEDGSEFTHDQKVGAFAIQIGDMLSRGEVTLHDVADLHGQTLLCWCKDERKSPEEQKGCHGDILAQVADAAFAQLADEKVRCVFDDKVHVMQFRDHYDFLSNFYLLPKPFMWKGFKCWTTEHAYQLSKFTNRPDIQAKIMENPKAPGKAKQIASKHKEDIDADWHDYSVRTMEAVTSIKYAEVFYPELHKKLLDTGRLVLVEGNWWNDTFYGWCLKSGRGENRLGRILMSQRLNMQIPF